MDDEVDAFGVCDPDLQEAAGLRWSDEHREVVQVEHSDWDAVRVQDVVVRDCVFPGARKNHGLHLRQVTLVAALQGAPERIAYRGGHGLMAEGGSRAPADEQCPAY